MTPLSVAISILVVLLFIKFGIHLFHWRRLEKPGRVKNGMILESVFGTRARVYGTVQSPVDGRITGHKAITESSTYIIVSSNGRGWRISDGV